MASDVDPPIAPFPFFVLRTPLFPCDLFLTLAKQVPHDDSALALKALFENDWVREALSLASPVLTQTLATSGNAFDDLTERAAQAFVRYLARMSCRATPFGLFAGCSLGTLGPTTRLELSSMAEYRTHTRIDGRVLQHIADTTMARRELRPVLTYTTNTSLYPVAGRLHYYQPIRSQGEVQYGLVALEPSPALTAVVQRARSETSYAQLLVTAIDHGVAEHDARSWLDQLIDDQVLISTVEPTVAGSDLIDALIQQLGHIEGCHAVATRLSELRETCGQLDSAPAGSKAVLYSKVRQLLGQLGHAGDDRPVCHVDLFKEADARLGTAVVDEVIKGVQLLQNACRPRQDLLARFREAFVHRYGAQRVPLVEVLDDECGMRFDDVPASAMDVSPLIAGLRFAVAKRDIGERWGSWERRMLPRLQRAWSTNAYELEIAPEEVLDSATPAPLPDSFVVRTEIAAPSHEAVDAGRFSVFVSHVLGPSGAEAFGRFCYGDAGIADAVRQILRREESMRPDAIFAEIVHRPPGPVANVIRRPVLRQHEIPVVARPGVAHDDQVCLGDLLVSVEEERVVLHSRRLGREVIPRMTNAHNGRFVGPAIYRFLCLLRLQSGGGVLTWTWGPFGDAPFLPRVRSGRVVLSLARWFTSTREIEDVFRADGGSREMALNEWRQQRAIPDRVILVEGDNRLCVDFRQWLSRDSFLDAVQKHASFVLEEMFPGPDELCTTSAEGRYAHEILIPFARRGDHNAGHSSAAARPHPSIQRTLYPGSEWVSMKAYISAADIDRVLRDVMTPLATEYVATGAVTQWCFVRYADPDWHLRVRFLLARGQDMSALLADVHERTAEPRRNGTIWKIEYDTYAREVERYGGPAGVLLAEQMFHVDSETVGRVLSLHATQNDRRERWRLGLLGIDDFFDASGLDVAARHRLARQLHDFRRRSGDSPMLRRQLGLRFREHRPSLERLLHERHRTIDNDGVSDALSERAERLGPLGRTLRDGVAQGSISVPYASFVGSYLHMWINKLLPSAHQQHELVTYDFLVRIYESRLARASRQAKTGPSAERPMAGAGLAGG